MNLSEYRAKFPQYKDIPDAQLADVLYKKHYAGKMDRDKFNEIVGVDWETREPLFWPVEYDSEGNVAGFDSDAGIVGVIKRTIMAPGDALKGKFNPMSDEGIGRANEAAWVMTPLGAKARAMAPRSAFKTVTPKAPSREALAEATSQGYKKAADMGVEYDARAVSRFAADLISDLDRKGYIAELAPEVHSLLRKLANPPEGATSVRLQDLEAARKVFGKIGGNIDKTKASAASQTVRAIDDFLATADPANVVPRTAATKGAEMSTPGYDFSGADAAATREFAEEAARTLKEARGNAAAGFRSDRITDVGEKVRRQAAAANSGRNFDNAARQKLKSLRNSEKRMRGFSDAEKRAIDDIIEGRPTKNAARFVGNLFGGGGGLGQMVTTGMFAGFGGATGGGLGAALAAGIPLTTGTVGKTIANRLTAGELRALGDLVRARSPLGKKTMIPRQVYAPRYGLESMGKATVAPNEDRRMALSRALRQ